MVRRAAAKGATRRTDERIPVSKDTTQESSGYRAPESSLFSMPMSASFPKKDESRSSATNGAADAKAGSVMISPTVSWAASFSAARPACGTLKASEKPGGTAAEGLSRPMKDAPMKTRGTRTIRENSTDKAIRRPRPRRLLDFSMI